MTTFPMPPEEPPVLPGDLWRWIVQGIALGMAFLGLVALVMHALGIE